MAKAGTGGALLASVVLAGITLAVFSSLQSYGPESVLRRFHLALLNDDKNKIASTVRENLSVADIQRLEYQLVPLLRSGDATIGGMDRDLIRSNRLEPQVRIVYIYKSPADGSPFPIVWVLEKHRGLWLISLSKTNMVLRDLMGT